MGVHHQIDVLADLGPHRLDQPQTGLDPAVADQEVERCALDRGEAVVHSRPGQPGELGGRPLPQAAVDVGVQRDRIGGVRPAQIAGQALPRLLGGQIAEGLFDPAEQGRFGRPRRRVSECRCGLGDRGVEPGVRLLEAEPAIVGGEFGESIDRDPGDVGIGGFTPADRAVVELDPHQRPAGPPGDVDPEQVEGLDRGTHALTPAVSQSSAGKASSNESTRRSMSGASRTDGARQTSVSMIPRRAVMVLATAIIKPGSDSPITR